jgi:hypothetical protein
MRGAESATRSARPAFMPLLSTQEAMVNRIGRRPATTVRSRWSAISNASRRSSTADDRCLSAPAWEVARACSQSGKAFLMQRTGARQHCAVCRAARCRPSAVADASAGRVRISRRSRRRDQAVSPESKKWVRFKQREPQPASRRRRKISLELGSAFSRVAPRPGSTPRTLFRVCAKAQAADVAGARRQFRHRQRSGRARIPQTLPPCRVRQRCCRRAHGGWRSQRRLRRGCSAVPRSPHPPRLASAVGLSSNRLSRSSRHMRPKSRQANASLLRPSASRPSSLPGWSEIRWRDAPDRRNRIRCRKRTSARLRSRNIFE